MRTELASQAAALLWALALGVLMGVLYDLLRPPRYRSGRMAGALLDLLYCLLCGAGAFLFAMADGGRPGLWELCAMLLGFLLYMHLLSRFLLPVFQRLASLCFGLIGVCKKNLGKAAISIKRFFQNMRK